MENITFIQPKELKELKTNFIIPKKLVNNSYIIAIKNNQNIISFIYFNMYDDYVQISYSFTNDEYRRLGYSSALRKFIIEFAKKNNKKYIISVPFENANTISILKKMGFIKNEKNDSYIFYF